MSKASPFEQIKKTARLHELTFEDALPHMPPDVKLADYIVWLEANKGGYKPTFGTRIQEAIEWSNANPKEFEAMVTAFDTALDFLNNSELVIDEGTFTNIAAYRNHRLGALPKIGGQDVHDVTQIRAAARDTGNKLRWGETIKPKDGEYYSYQTFIKSDEGMVAASITDLYENYMRTLNLYPKDTGVGSIVANAITEAAYLTDPGSDLFTAYKNREDGWIYKYPGFSQQFQELVYGEADTELEPNSDFDKKLDQAFARPLHRTLAGKPRVSPEDLAHREQYFSPHATIPENIKIRSFETHSAEYEVSTEDPDLYPLLLAQAKQKLEIAKGLDDPGLEVTEELNKVAWHETTHGKMAWSFDTSCRYGVRILFDSKENIWALSPFHALVGDSAGVIMLTRLEEAAIAVAPEDASPADMQTAHSLGYSSREEVLNRLYELRPDLKPAN